MVSPKLVFWTGTLQIKECGFLLRGGTCTLGSQPAHVFWNPTHVTHIVVNKEELHYRYQCLRALAEVGFSD